MKRYTLWLRSIAMVACSLLVLSACSEQDDKTPAPDPLEGLFVGDATLTVTGLPEGAKVVSMSWFPGRKDDDPQGVLYKYTDGVTVPAGKYIFLIEGKGYEPLMARRIPVFGNTVLEAKMCKLDSGCYGTLTEVSH